MKNAMSKSCSFGVVSIVVLFVLVVFLEMTAFAAHEVYIRDINGTPVTIGGNTPYSPKQTCGLVNCHVDMVKSFGLTSGNIYESGTGFAAKDDGTGTASYSSPYPLHGVSAGFHFQTGKNVPWGRTQRDYYNVPGNTSSPGMYGNFCLSTGRQLAGLTEDGPGFDISSYDFSHSECAWCHSGGGPLEYDREGYRYDGVTGLFRSGLNPDPKKGDYYRFDTNTGTIVSKVTEWQAGGVAEVDCLLCHLKTTIGGFRFGMLERNFAFSSSGSPQLAASLGLSGPTGTTGILKITRQGDAAGNPVIDRSGWMWTTNLVDPTTSPDKENCALCHFADKSLMTNGPGGLPLGYTVMQKLIPAGTADDGDIQGGGKNGTDWKTLSLRAESGKSAESINDTLNGDAHMDAGTKCSFCHNLLGTARDYNNDCVTCHYDMWGYPAPPEVTPVAPQVFPALSDAQGNIIQPAVELLRIDHQFAKGNNKPDGMLMDQLDNTVTCESCHITRTHPNSSAAPSPAAAHAAFPAFHFEKIDCRACHIPAVNGPVKRVLADLTAGTYRTSERGQIRENPTGAAYRPLYIFRHRDLNGALKIEPVTTQATAFWSDQTPEGSRSVLPRIAQRAAEAFREIQGTSAGIYNWTLNRPQNGDTALIVNTQAEITGMVEQLRLQGAAEPVLTIGIDQVVPSHNLATKSSGKILGSPAGGGCIMCHSSSDPASPNYSSRSVGFFDKTYTLFDQPADGGRGLVQTLMNDSGGNPVKRVDIRFSAFKIDGSSLSLDLSGADGETAGNTINQFEVIGIEATYLATLLDPQAAGIAKPTASFSWVSDASVSKQVNFDSAPSTCSGACTYTWDFGDSGVASGPTISHVYASAGAYPVKLTVEDTTHGMTASTTVTVTAKLVNTAPTASKTTPVVSGMTVSFTDTSTDAQDAPAALTVTVNWGDGTTSTGKGGDAFTRTYSLAGSYTIRHSVTDTGGLTSSSANATVSVTAKYSISGSVVDGAAVPVSGVTMYLKQGTTVKRTLTTGADGTYSFTNLLTGCYIVQPSKTGRTFSPATQTVCVGPNAAGINFTAQ